MNQYQQQKWKGFGNKIEKDSMYWLPEIILSHRTEKITMKHYQVNLMKIEKIFSETTRNRKPKKKINWK